jgi:type IV pilus assembly protein PilN
MRISINLATRPFVELRPFFLRLRIVMAGLVLVGAGAIVAAHFLQKQLDVQQAQLDRLQAKTTTAQQEKQGNERKMRKPANAAVLDRAHFLNALFLRKSFSWTAVMMDLETVLPSGVQITSIEPAPTSSGDVVIRMRVSGERDRAVQLVRNLERSKRFLQPRLTGEATKAKDTGNPASAAANPGAPAAVEFEILANYNPLPKGQSFTTIRGTKQENLTNSRTPATSKSGKGDGVVLKPYGGKGATR